MIESKMKNKEYERYRLIKKLAALVSPRYFQKIILYVKNFSNEELKEVILFYRQK